MKSGKESKEWPSLAFLNQEEENEEVDILKVMESENESKVWPIFASNKEGKIEDADVLKVMESEKGSKDWNSLTFWNHEGKNWRGWCPGIVESEKESKW